MTSANNTGILSEKLKLTDSEMVKNIRLGPILNLKKKEIKMFPRVVQIMYCPLKLKN